MRYIVAVAIGLIASLWVTVPVSAHVLVMDDAKTAGAILHIIPDDDPIAGQDSSIYFDMQEFGTAENRSVFLYVKDKEGIEQKVPMRLSGNLATGAFMFPAQGTYAIRIVVETANDQVVFHHVQRVTRGQAKNIIITVDHSWADGLIVGSLIGLVVLLVIVFNRRRLIMEQSTF